MNNCDRSRLIISLVIPFAAIVMLLIYHSWFNQMQEADSAPIISAEAGFIGSMLAERREEATTSLDLMRETPEVFIEELLDENGDNDLLQWIYKDISVREDGDGYHVTISYTETATEENFVENKIPEIISIAGLTARDTKYDKVKKICEFFRDNYTYDETGIAATPVLCIETGEYTCQSISILMYKVFRKLGIGCRIVAGTYEGEPHGWLQVMVGSRWQNLDFTLWAKTGNYFLVPSTDMRKHKLYKAYAERKC